MNNLMSDIQNGFVHRRLPDGGFKVRMIIIIIFLTLSDQEKKIVINHLIIAQQKL